MKVLTILQPWASFLACGAKQYETRSWQTKYRGPIAIHAAKKDPAKMSLLGMKEFEEECKKVFEEYDLATWAFLPTGCVIATAELVNCWHIVYNPGTNIDIAKNIPVGAELEVPRKHPDFNRYIVPTEREKLFGDWTPGRYAWEFANVKILEEPISVKGQQGLWNWNEFERTV